MKKLSSAAFMLATSILVSNFGSAQTISPVIGTETIETADHVAATPARLVTPVTTKTTSAEEVKVHPKALRSFTRNCTPDAPARWYSDKDFFMAYYSEGGIQYRVSYKKNGTWYQTLKRYTAEHLDSQTRRDVEETYDGYEIAGISELNIGAEKIYYINLQSRTKLKEVVLYDGQMSVTKQFTLR